MTTNENQILSAMKLDVNDTGNDVQESTITFKSINYYVNTQQYCNICQCPCLEKTSKQILTDLTGIFQVGMNAIMGPTGCGKSSLLDLLADRKDRQGFEGEILFNGQLQNRDYKYRVGYVVQDDIISGTLTVKENLMFSANIRLSTKLSSKEKEDIVDEVITQLGLERCADTTVGTDFKRGVSGGERKRTNIGMELVLSPAVLFLDEPTTGKFIGRNLAPISILLHKVWIHQWLKAFWNVFINYLEKDVRYFSILIFLIDITFFVQY